MMKCWLMQMTINRIKKNVTTSPVDTAVDNCWQENSKNTAMKSIIDYGEENASCNLSYRYSLCLTGSLNKILRI